MAELQEELNFFEKIRTEPEFERFDDRPIAYFCAEFDLDTVTQRVYSGGLGVLAGDIVREAGDRKLPMVAVGLYYREGYVCATRKIGDRTQELCDPVSPRVAGCEAIRSADGERLHVDVPIHDRIVKCRVWKVAEAPIDVYLLDTNCEENTPEDRHITDRLYVADKEIRLKQEIVLGIGGLRALEALKIHPHLFHLNEGHSALLAIELIQHEMRERGIGFDEAKQYARRRIVMTNHTLVPAGQEIFGYDLTAMLLERYAEERAIPVRKLVDLGRVPESSEFSMSMLAFRTASVINAVSKLHATEAKKIWHDFPMVAVTNGVHVPKWDRIGEATGSRELWDKHQQNKAELLNYVNEVTDKKWNPNTLVIGWARRIVKYKRPLAAFFDLQRLAAICRNADRPVRIIYAGYPHPSDDVGRELMAQIREHAEGDLEDVVAIMPGYDTAVAKLMVSGCDIWLNTPVVGFEACGTSGMKAALNGVLPLSTNDGWIAEADIQRIGWLMHNDHVSDDFYDKLENEIAPLYYTRDEQEGYPELWEGNMRRCREMIMHQFTATRMMREYWEMLYL